MTQALWAFIIVSVVIFAGFFLRPPWSLENIVMGGVPLVLLLFFGYRFWRAKKEQTSVLPDEED